MGNLDQMTQQNAALVEESSAAVNAMHDQAQRLKQALAAFDLGGVMQPTKPAVPTASRTEPVLRQSVAPSTPAKSAAVLSPAKVHALW